MSKNVAYNANLNGFVPFERYYFEFSGLGGNWPAIVSPATGYFTTDSEGKYHLAANVSFCANTGSVDCNPLADGYLSFNENLLVDLDLFNTLQLDVKDTNNVSVLSKTETVDCPECRPSLSIESPHFVNLLKSNDAQADFNIHIDGLQIGENYRYEIRSLFGNWPMYVTPSGGSFKSYEHTRTLTFTADACASGTGCPAESLLSEYELDDRDSYYAGFKFVLIDSEDVEDASSVVEAICENCLPDAPQILTVQNQILTSSTSDTNTRNVDILNLNPTQTYYYVVENIVTDSDIVVYPQSGTIVKKAQHTFELDTVFCGSSECASSAHYVAANSQGSGYIGVQPHDVTFDIKLYSSYDGMNYSGLVASLDNIKTTCDKCVKIPTVSLNNNLENITLTDTNTLSIVGAVGNLVVGQQYQYLINNASSTWPVEIMKPSGVFTARSTTKNISSSIKFCEASGICPDAVFDVNDIDYDYQNVVLNMTIETLNSSIEDVISDNLNVTCDECIEDHRIGGISNAVYPQKYSVENIIVTDDTYNFSTRFDNLVVGQEYTYAINVTDSNWPVYLHKHSGSFTADTSTVILPNRIRFCPTSNGECSANNLTVSEIGALSTRLDDIYFNLNINLSGELVDVNLDSHNIEIKCDDCLDVIEFTTIAASELLSTNPSNNNPIGDIFIEANGFEPNREYFYIVNSGDNGSWPFIIRNLSGYFTPTDDAFNLTVPYEVVANTGIGMYDTSATLPYTYDPNLSIKFKNISFTVGSYDADINNSVSAPVPLLCEGCFDDPNTNQLNVLSLVGDRIAAGADVQIPLQIENTASDYRYGYRISSLSSNWPYTIDIPSTGYITATDNTHALSLTASFCATSGGSCFGNRFNTDISSASDIATDYENIENKFRVEVSGLQGDPLTTNISYVDITLECDSVSRLCINRLATSLEPNGFGSFIAPSLAETNPDLNLSKNTFYYQVNGTDLNWPIGLDNHSGYIRGDDEIELDFSLCATTGGSCAINSPFSYSLSSCSDDNTKTGTFDIYYSGVDIDISPTNTDDFTIIFDNSNLATIQVEDALSVSSAPTILTNANGPEFTLTYNVSNLYYDEQYEYSFHVTDSNWPLELSVYSGTFVATDTTRTISTILRFCNKSDGSCAASVDSAGLIDYTLDNFDPQTQITLQVSGINCDINDGTSTVKTIQCQNCLDNIDFDNISDVTLTSDDNFNLLLDLTNSNGFDSSESYFYQITRHNSNWPIHVDSMSGTISNTDILTIPFYFCPTSSGTCSLNSNTFAANPGDCLVKNNDKYGIFDIMVSGSGLDIDNKVSNRFTITANDDILSHIDISTDRSVFLLDENTGNRFNINYQISNITAGDTYLYNIDSVNANWPVKILEGSTGSFVAEDDMYMLQLTVEMCATTGNACSDTALDYTPNENCLMPINPVYSAGLEIDVWTSGSSGCEVADGRNNSVSMTCSDCLGNIKVTPPANRTIEDTNTELVGFDIEGLKNGQSYTYQFSAEDANWPISMTPISGEFTAVGSLATLSSELMFCYPSGLCADKDNALPYTEYTYYDKITKGSDLFGDIKLTISPNSECEEIADTSDAVRIACRDCLPAFTYASIVMSGSPEISLPESCCTGSMPVYVNVTQAVPGESYTYNFSASSQSITFNPVSGTVYFDGTGAGTVITTVESELDLYGMSIIQCELIHDNTQEKVIDMIAMRCGESCPVE